MILEETKNLNYALLLAMDVYARQTCFKIKRQGHYQDITYQEFRQLTFRLVRFFQRQGIAHGERIAVTATNSLEWMVAFVAALLAGGAVTPLHITNAPDILQAMLKDSGARLAVLDEPVHLQKISAAIEANDEEHLPDLKMILTTISSAELLPNVTSLKAVLAEPLLSPEEEATIRLHAQSVAPQALALIHYVTGKLDLPKGVVFDQARLLATMRHMAAWFTFDEDDVAFTLRPWSEFPNLITSLHYFLAGIANALVDDYSMTAENMQQTSPTVMLSMPTTFEQYYEEKMNWIAEQPQADQKVFQWALKKDKEYRAAGESASPALRQEYLRADLTFFNQLRGDIGGRFRRFYSAVAPPPQEVSEFFEAIGLPILNVYCLTEAGGFPVVSSLKANRLNACGQVAPGFQVRLADDSEILVRGEMVMREYWRRPEETQQVFAEEGWLRTGDIGRFDDDGYLHIISRKGHTIVLSTGRRIAPVTIENALTASPFIKQAAIIGEGKPHLSAMLVLDLKTLIAHFEEIKDEEGKPVDTTTHPKVKQLLDEIIGQVNSRLDREERITVYSLLDQPLSKDTGELTASLKISRHVVAEHYAAKIEAMYPLPPQLKAAEISRVQVEPERLRALLEKESLLYAWLTDAGIEFLFELARQKQIDAPSMVHICDAVATIAQLESEEKPLSTALIVGDPARINRVLPPSQIRLLYSDRIGRMRKNLVALARVVDGRVLGYVVDKHGYVRGINKLRVPLDHATSFLLGPQFRHHAAISKHCDAVVFFVPAGGRQVRVFAEGQLVGRYSNGDWSPENMLLIDQQIAQLAEKKSYDLALIRRVLGCAFQMSEKNLGAIFMIGDADVILKNSDISEISHFAVIVSASMNSLSDQELINFAEQDGATIIDAHRKEFRGCMVLLRPDADTQAEIGPGRGARHSSAAKMSAEANCLAIIVSHDGPITIYDTGQRVLLL